MIGNWTWLIRCSLDKDQFKLDLKHVISNSALLKNESVESTLEYAQSKIMVTLKQPADILILHNWNVIKCLSSFSIGDVTRHCFLLHGFNEEKFPFVVCSGQRTFSLINVKEFRIEHLIKS